VSPRLVLLAGPGESTRIVYHALAAEFDVAKVILEDPVPRSEFLRRRARRYGWAKVFGQALFVALIVPYLRFEARTRIAEIKRQHRLRDEPIDEAKILHVPSANAPECRSALTALAPDIVVVNGTRILSKELLDAIAVPFLNIHAGITPMYRGVHGGYWALANDDPEHCGVTVHRVDAGIDTGTVLGQDRIEITRGDNFSSYPMLQLVAGLRLLQCVIRAGQFQQLLGLPGAPSQLWAHPTILDYCFRRLRRSLR
jgi:folate-dependent phosphoribosylglycinamide formyltransferase PurN